MSEGKKLASRVFELVRQVPRGCITTYKELARAAKTHPRVVAHILRCNPDPVLTPCHRVVAADMKLGGYFGVADSPQKLFLLREEGVETEAVFPNSPKRPYDRVCKAYAEEHLYRFK